MQAVIDDVRRGFISATAARIDYGVVLNDELEPDEDATARLREMMPTEAAEFRHGPGRVAFETIWTLERYDALHRILAEVPVTWRFFVKQRLFAALKTPGDAADVFDAYTKLRREFADLPSAP
jgi:N-methylhydantoinase B